jgi:hypothetical protein
LIAEIDRVEAEEDRQVSLAAVLRELLRPAGRPVNVARALPLGKCIDGGS